MKFLYALIFLLATAPVLSAQTLEAVPAQGNPFLRSHASQQDLQQAADAERLTGVKPPAQNGDRIVEACPPVFFGNLLLPGDTARVTLDPFFHNDTVPSILTLLNFQPLLFGTAVLDTFELSFAANPTISGVGTDTVFVQFSLAGEVDTVEVVFNVRREGNVVVANPKIVDPETITQFCLDSELELPAPKSCSVFLENDPGYDGAGQQLFHFTSYQFADTCFLYYASRFPGTDTVSVRICDEFTVCDTFKIPFVIRGDTIQSLPFFDDFSSYDSPHPSSDFWLDKDVFVNATLANDPPSVRFATFDGLDRRGDPLNLISGAGDRLTSKPIDLSGLSPANTVSLRFFVAAKGHGLDPDLPDTLMLEFRNDQRQWVRQASFQDTTDFDLDSFPPFVFKGFAIDSAQYFHEAFQFRFTGFTSPGGIGDLWHVDYVFLGTDVSETNSTFRDIAFTELPSKPLKNYTSMPWKHFKGQEEEELSKDFEAHFYNHFDTPKALGNSSVNYRETTLPLEFNQPFTIDETGENLPPKTHTTRIGTIPQDKFGAIVSLLEGIPAAGFRNLETEFAFFNSDQVPNFFRVNDTVFLQTPFSNYFAHDDGTAEWQVFVKFAAGGEQVAAQFRTNVADTLRAVQFQFPHVNGDVQNQLFNLRVWLDSLGGEPVFEREVLKPFYPNNAWDTLQGFTTYVLDNFEGEEVPLAIPAGRDFFVGWQQVTPTQLGIPVGFDIQNDCGCNWANLNGTWSKFSSFLKGSLMIRPVFGSTYNTSSGAEETPAQAASAAVEVFPNPTSGELRFLIKTGNFSDYSVVVFNQLGQKMLSSALSPQLSLHGLSDGVYFLQILDEKTGGRFTEKILLSKSH